MKISYKSDLHLEGSNMDFSNWISGDVIVIAGDLCCEEDYAVEAVLKISQLSNNKPIIWVLGNHEYEGKNIYFHHLNLKDRFKHYPNIHVLQNESVEIDGVLFIGSTLWSDFASTGYQETLLQSIKFHVSDFSSIKGRNGFISSHEMLEFHNKAVEFINSFKDDIRTKVVVTHFAPSLKSRDTRFPLTHETAYWCNSLEDLASNFDAWIHGHVHTSAFYKIGDCQVACNPRGWCDIFNFSRNQSFKPLMLEVAPKEKT